MLTNQFLINNCSLSIFLKQSNYYITAMIIDHYSLDGHEYKHKFKVTRNIGTDEHLRKAIQSHTSFNSLRVGSPNRIMTIRKKVPILLSPYLIKLNLLNMLNIKTSLTYIILIPINTNLESTIFLF